MTIGTKLPQAVLRPGMVFFWQTIDEVFGMIDSSREWNSSESFDFRFETERKRSNYSFSPKMTKENNEKKKLRNRSHSYKSFGLYYFGELNM